MGWTSVVRNRVIQILLVIGVVLLGVWLLNAILWSFGPGEENSAYRDVFGVIGTLISAFALLLIAVTVHLQNEQLEIQKKEIDKADRRHADEAEKEIRRFRPIFEFERPAWVRNRDNKKMVEGVRLPVLNRGSGVTVKRCSSWDEDYNVRLITREFIPGGEEKEENKHDGIFEITSTKGEPLFDAGRPDLELAFEVFYEDQLKNSGQLVFHYSAREKKVLPTDIEALGQPKLELD